MNEMFVQYLRDCKTLYPNQRSVKYFIGLAPGVYAPLNCQTSVSIEFAFTMVLLWCRGLQLWVRYWSAPTRLHPCGRWLLTRAVCGRPVQLSSNSMMSDIDSESADFFNDSPNFFVKN